MRKSQEISFSYVKACLILLDIVIIYLCLEVSLGGCISRCKLVGVSRSLSKLPCEIDVGPSRWERCFPLYVLAPRIEWWVHVVKEARGENTGVSNVPVPLASGVRKSLCWNRNSLSGRFSTRRRLRLETAEVWVKWFMQDRTKR